MAILGKVDKFNIGKRRMATVCGTVDTFFHANYNDNAEKKRTLLLPVIGPVKMYKLLRDLQYVLALARKLTTNWP